MLLDRARVHRLKMLHVEAGAKCCPGRSQNDDPAIADRGALQHLRQFINEFRRKGVSFFRAVEGDCAHPISGFDFNISVMPPWPCLLSRTSPIRETVIHL